MVPMLCSEEYRIPWISPLTSEEWGNEAQRQTETKPGRLSHLKRLCHQSKNKEAEPAGSGTGHADPQVPPLLPNQGPCAWEASALSWLVSKIGGNRTYAEDFRRFQWVLVGKAFRVLRCITFSLYVSYCCCCWLEGLLLNLHLSWQKNTEKGTARSHLFRVLLYFLKVTGSSPPNSLLSKKKKKKPSSSNNLSSPGLESHFPVPLSCLRLPVWRAMVPRFKLRLVKFHS